MPEFKTFTYKDDRENSKNSSQNANSVVSVKEEDLINVASDTHRPPVNSMDTFKYSSAKQNEWVRMLFQDKKSVNEINKEIEEFTLKSNGFDYKKETKAYTKNGETYGPESPFIQKLINSSDAWALKRGVESALEFAKYFDTNKKEGDRLFTNDTIDAVNKIDFVQTDVDENNNIGVINLIQIKSSRPENQSDIELIKKEHEKYLKNIEQITQKEIIRTAVLNHGEDTSKVIEEYGDRIFDVMISLSEFEKEKKEIEGNILMENIIKDNNIPLTKEDLIFLSFVSNNDDGFSGILAVICGDSIDKSDISVFKNWLNAKTNFEDSEVKKSFYKEYKPKNIVSGRKFNSVIYYKVGDKWGKMVESLD